MTRPRRFHVTALDKKNGGLLAYETNDRERAKHFQALRGELAKATPRNIVFMAFRGGRWRPG